jgi:hypothetical protein
LGKNTYSTQRGIIVFGRKYLLHTKGDDCIWEKILIAHKEDNYIWEKILIAHKGG